MNRDAIAQRLAARLKAARKGQGLNLAALSKLSGVSTSMISQVERGETNPTVAIIWSLSQALGVDFAGLLEEDAADRAILSVIRADQAPVIARHGTGCRIRILSSPEMVGETEIYDLSFDNGGALESTAHKAGCEESLTVFSGAVRVEAGEAFELLQDGDAIRYRADRTHAIRAEGGPARAILVVKGA